MALVQVRLAKDGVQRDWRTYEVSLRTVDGNGNETFLGPPIVWMSWGPNGRYEGSW